MQDLNTQIFSVVYNGTENLLLCCFTASVLEGLSNDAQRVGGGVGLIGLGSCWPRHNSIVAAVSSAA